MQQEQSISRILFLKIRFFVQLIFLGMIKGYRYIISPLLPPSCRFTPTCSCYAAKAIESHGPFKGGFLALCRVLRCHPFCKGGYDPVPPVNDESGTERRDKSSRRTQTGCKPLNAEHNPVVLFNNMVTKWIFTKPF